MRNIYYIKNICNKNLLKNIMILYVNKFIGVFIRIVFLAFNNFFDIMRCIGGIAQLVRAVES